MAKTETFRQAAKRYKLSAAQLDGEITKALNKIGHQVVADCKRNTPTDTGHMKRNWMLEPARKEGDTIRAYVVNPVEYSFYVNNGHRAGNAWVPGRFMLEQALTRVMPEFESEMVDRIYRLMEGRA